MGWQEVLLMMTLASFTPATETVVQREVVLCDSAERMQQLVHYFEQHRNGRIRRGCWTTFDPEAWNMRGALPLGVVAGRGVFQFRHRETGTIAYGTNPPLTVWVRALSSQLE